MKGAVSTVNIPKDIAPDLLIYHMFGLDIDLWCGWTDEMEPKIFQKMLTNLKIDPTYRPNLNFRIKDVHICHCCGVPDFICSV